MPHPQSVVVDKSIKVSERLLSEDYTNILDPPKTVFCKVVSQCMDESY